MNIYLRLANYISRYAPSRAKIIEYLEKKNQENPEKILEEIGYDEDLMLDAWMRTFINTGKWKQEIIRKLLLKQFEKEKIFAKISQYENEITDWENVKFYIIRWIENRLQKGKSTMVLKMELFQKYPYFKDEIADLFAEYNNNVWLKKEIEKYSQKYNLSDKKDLQKFYAALMRKGFQYDEIKKFLKSEE